MSTPTQPLPGPMPPAPALLADADFTAVVSTVLDNNPGMEPALAARIVTQAIAFIATAAAFRHEVIAPSRVVDEGWHALILHTAMYAELCERLGGFVHHYPERPDTGRFDEDVIDRTTALIAEAGYTVDAELWSGPTDRSIPVAANCQHSGGPNCGPIVPIPQPKPGKVAGSA